MHGHIMHHTMNRTIPYSVFAMLRHEFIKPTVDKNISTRGWHFVTHVKQKQLQSVGTGNLCSFANSFSRPIFPHPSGCEVIRFLSRSVLLLLLVSSVSIIWQRRHAHRQYQPLSPSSTPAWFPWGCPQPDSSSSTPAWFSRGCPQPDSPGAVPQNQFYLVSNSLPAQNQCHLV